MECCTNKIRQWGDDYYNPEHGFVAQDLHDENAVALADGSIAIFDPVPVVPDNLDYTKGGMLHGEEQLLKTR